MPGDFTFSVIIDMMAGAAGGIAGGISSALHSGGTEDLSMKVKEFVCQILPKLDKKAIIKRQIKLCEAFCLLWHHRRLGTVDGRQTSDKLISCTYAGVILDLWSAGKIEIVPKKSANDPLIKVQYHMKMYDQLLLAVKV